MSNFTPRPIKRVKVAQTVRPLVVSRADVAALDALFIYTRQQNHSAAHLSAKWWHAVRFNDYQWTLALLRGLLGLTSHRPVLTRLQTFTAGWCRLPGGYLIAPWLVLAVGQARVTYPTFTEKQLRAVAERFVLVPVPLMALEPLFNGMCATGVLPRLSTVFAETLDIPAAHVKHLQAGHAPAVRKDSSSVGARLDMALLVWNGRCVQELLPEASDVG